MATTLIIPGIYGSTGAHWQNWWLRHDPNAVLVEQADWDRPCPSAWADALIDAVRAHPYAWLVAHSLGAPLVARVAAERLDLQIAGALLVAPADLDAWNDAPDTLRVFGAMPLAPLPFPSLMVASRNDPCMRFRRARDFAAAWGSRFVDYGRAGHVNVASGFGPWPDGPRLLAEVQRSRRRSRADAPIAAARRHPVPSAAGAYA